MSYSGIINHTPSYEFGYQKSSLLNELHFIAGATPAKLSIVSPEHDPASYCLALEELSNHKIAISTPLPLETGFEKVWDIIPLPKSNLWTTCS